jgi:hypothetical protein
LAAFITPTSATRKRPSRTANLKTTLLGVRGLHVPSPFTEYIHDFFSSLVRSPAKEFQKSVWSLFVDESEWGSQSSHNQIKLRTN